jgi:cytochrome c553
MKMILTSAMIAGAMLLGATKAGSADAAAVWAKHCGFCHGKDGKGQTKMGKKSGARDYTDAAVQSSFSDAEALEAIKEGVTEDGKNKMKGYADKVSDDEAKALVAYIRAFKK